MTIDNQHSDFYPYLLAIIPDKPVGPALSQLKNSIAQFIEPNNYQPPHIKLFPVFMWNDKEEYLLVQHIKNNLPKLFSFEVELKNFAFNKQKSQLYVNTYCKHYFDAIHLQIKDYFSYQSAQSQLTMDDINGQLIFANGDLKENTVLKAWKIVKNKSFEASFYANKITLLKQDNTAWHILKEFHLD